jgi:NDP-sugar pyrophosphorylase family protein
MTRFITNIRRKSVKEGDGISVAILAAGSGNKIRSYEPRSLLKLRDKRLIDHQLDTVSNFFEKSEIITVVGCHANKVIKRVKPKSRIVENQLHSETNSSESMRLAFNNAFYENFMFVHGDIYFNEAALQVDYSKSFVITDSSKMIKDNEIGVTQINQELSIMSYGLPVKWAQIAFFTGQEYKILNSIFSKFEGQEKKKLSFEIINQVISRGGKFQCYEPNQMKLKEIDRIKDIEQ